MRSVLSVPAIGGRLEIWGVVIDVARDDVLVESRIIMDTLGLMQQLWAISQS